MVWITDFNKSQRKELVTLGLCKAQIEKLRLAVAFSRSSLDKPAAKNDMAALLDEVVTLSERLSQRLRALNSQRDAACASVNARLEVGYWCKRPQDDGPTAAHHLCPRLDALRDSAQEAKASLPAGPVRHLAASPAAIEKIDSALRDGWRQAHRSGVSTSDAPVPVSPPYPARLKPSASSSSAFRRICGICYVVAGRGDDADPERAIKAYMAQMRTGRAKAKAAFEKGLKRERRERARDRTHPKI
jgi:hypothetical protein